MNEIREKNRASHIIFQDPDDSKPSLQATSDQGSMGSSRTGKSPLTVVLLSGGYCERITQEIAQYRNILPKDSHRLSIINGLAKTTVRGDRGKERICPGLLSVNGHHILDYYLSGLSIVDRLAPLNKRVFIVCNEIDKHLFTEPSGYLHRCQSIVKLDSNSIISNGSSSPQNWKGDVADLATAIRVANIEGPVLAISMQNVFVPEYKFFRVIEHAMIRAEDVIAYSPLLEADIQQAGKEPLPVLEFKQGCKVPPVAGLQLVAANELPLGAPIAAPFIFLQPTTLPLVGQSQAGNLVELAMEMLDKGHPLWGIDLEWGRFGMHTVAHIDYTDNYFFWRYKGLGTAVLRPGDDHMLTLGTDPMTPLGAPGMLDPRQLALEGGPPMNASATLEFDKTFFGSRDTEERCLGPQFYKLPPAFYKTTYKRQCETGTAETIRRR